MNYKIYLNDLDQCIIGFIFFELYNAPDLDYLLKLDKSPYSNASNAPLRQLDDQAQFL
jgi:hypothetical protein